MKKKNEEKMKKKMKKKNNPFWINTGQKVPDVNLNNFLINWICFNNGRKTPQELRMTRPAQY